MRRGIIGFLFIAGLLAPTAWSQDPGGDDAQRRRGAMRERPFGPGGPWGGPEAMARRISEQLVLDADQQAQFDAILSRYQPGVDADGVDPRERMRDLGRQMREARESGDEVALETLREQMREMREQGRARFEQMFQEVEGILREDQKVRLGEMREQFQQRRGPMDLAERANELRRDLNLDESQQAAFDKLLEETRAKLNPGDGPEGWRERMMEYRNARESGDEARVREMEEEFEQRRSAREAAVNEFYAQLDPILHDDQRQVLAQFREGGRRGGDRQRERTAREAGVEVRDVLRAAQRLQMDKQQEEMFEDIRDEARELERTARGREARIEAGQRVRQMILEILTDDQKREFERALSRNQRGGERPERRPGRGEPRNVGEDENREMAEEGTPK